MKFQKINSVQNWLPFEQILENGIIKLKNNCFVKIIKINPINFNLKSELEKEAIFNSYKIFLKTCNFNFQILIQSNKENLTNHINDIEKQITSENEELQIISHQYIHYIKKLNHEQKSSSKNFYIILREEINQKEIKNSKEFAIQNLNEKYFKIKDCLARCGNSVTDCTNQEEVQLILYSFLNSRNYFNYTI